MSNFQAAVDEWCLKCFGEEVSRDVQERCWRFFEEAAELVQSLGMPLEECKELIDYVYNRPTGEPDQEVGGVMVTLAALCNAKDINMMRAGDLEIFRVEGLIDRIREKHANKPHRKGPLPGQPTTGICKHCGNSIGPGLCDGHCSPAD